MIIRLQRARRYITPGNFFPKPGHWLYHPPAFKTGGYLVPIHKTKGKSNAYYNQRRWPFELLKDDGWRTALKPDTASRLCMKSVECSPDGTFHWCIFGIGNLKNDTVLNLLHNAVKSPVYQYLKQGGLTPYALARDVDATYGTNLTKRDYTSTCHLCARIFNVINFDGSPRGSFINHKSGGYNAAEKQTS